MSPEHAVAPSAASSALAYRRFGRLAWSVSEIGHGTWGMGRGPSGWQDSTDEQAIAALDESVRLGCTFFDTAWIYGRGHSERLVGQLLRRFPERRLHVATKIAPKNRRWPSRRGDRIEDAFPTDHIVQMAEQSRANLGVPSIDLLLFHVWEDDWAALDGWKRAIDRLKRTGVVEAIGISVNTWEPANVLETLRTGLIDAVEVVYNLFEQRPDDALFPACAALDVAVIARVPFDEGSLTGALSLDTRFPATDWRSTYFVPENLRECIPRVERLRALLMPGMTLSDLALAFILHNQNVSTVIPGMRRPTHVRENLRVSGRAPLPPELLAALRRHRWDREPTWWSQ